MEPLEPSEPLENLLAGYVLGDMTPEESAQVKQLLDHNPDLLAELHQLQSTLAVIPLSLPVSSPSEQLEMRILQAAEANASPVTRSPAKPSSRMRLSWWGGAIAAVIIGALGIETYRLQQQVAASQLENQRLQQQLATAQTMLDRIRQTELATTRKELSRYQEAVNLLRQPKNRFLTLLGTKPKLHASGSLVIVPTKESAILVLREVIPLPQGEVYRLWALVNGRKVTCGDFQPNAQGDVFVQLPLEQWGGATEVVVTIEPDRALPMPIGEMVIIGS